MIQNCTPHPVPITNSRGLTKVIPESSRVLRIKHCGTVGFIQNAPPKIKGILYIVSANTRMISKREDFISPADVIEEGDRVVSCRAFMFNKIRSNKIGTELVFVNTPYKVSVDKFWNEAILK